MTDDNKEVTSTGKRKPPAAGMGRVKGTPNKVTGDIRKMLREALESAGGTQYLLEQSRENPVAFMGLIGKIIPKEVETTISGSVQGINVSFVDPTPK